MSKHLVGAGFHPQSPVSLVEVSRRLRVLKRNEPVRNAYKLDAMASNVVTVTMVFENAKAAKALRVACDCLEQCQDLEWRPEIKRATKAMRYAMKNIGVAQCKR